MTTVRDIITEVLTSDNYNLLDLVKDKDDVLIDAARLGLPELVKALSSRDNLQIEVLMKAICLSSDPHTIALLLSLVLPKILEYDDLYELSDLLVNIKDTVVSYTPDSDTE